MKTKTFKNGVIEANAVSIFLDECMTIDGLRFENPAYLYTLLDKDRHPVAYIKMMGRNKMKAVVTERAVRTYIGAVYEITDKGYLFPNVTQFSIKNRKTATFYENDVPIFDLDYSVAEYGECGLMPEYIERISQHYEDNGEFYEDDEISYTIERYALSYINEPCMSG